MNDYEKEKEKWRKFGKYFDIFGFVVIGILAVAGLVLGVFSSVSQGVYVQILMAFVGALAGAGAGFCLVDGIGAVIIEVSRWKK